MNYYKITTTKGIYHIATSGHVRNRRQASAILCNRFNVLYKDEEILNIGFSNFFNVMLDKFHHR